ncbi:hypothetical protein J4H92_12365 [Leucobacter weissii]|uniref:Fibronectin type-III domain-containing protein n=1 Tax=Leucobacter weissii TaxID=1983706 RepID=A0A939S6T9_9MICO|nr:Ig-like domain-containing protein [Leucobacter weissii]MBO1902739.1 hypothetical protein [Leucobacter weissii]
MSAQRAWAARGPRRRPSARRPRWVGWTAVGVSAALVTTLAVVADGFDSQETPREDPSVWVTASALDKYARVNTETAEIDTVQSVEAPSGVVRAGDLDLVLTQGKGKAWPIDPTLPTDIVDDSPASDPGGADDAELLVREGSGAGAAAMRTPSGTEEVIAAGEAVVFRTDEGQVHLARTTTARGASARDAAAEAAEIGEPGLIDPYAEERAADEGAAAPDGQSEEAPEYRADAVAIDSTGLVALFSEEEAAIRWYDSEAGEFRGGPVELPQPELLAGVEEPQLSIVGGEWALLDAAGGRLWREGRDEATTVQLAGDARLQASSVERGERVLIADGGGLWAIGDEATREAEASGAPAQPRAFGGEMLAAWIGADDGALWRSSTGETIPLELGEAEREAAAKRSEELSPVIRASGGAALLAEEITGLLWRLPDGKPIPLSQWAMDEDDTTSQDTEEREVKDQEPPVAEDDAFGVRAGEPTLLPVLLNDHDPNRDDVLTIVPESVEGLPEDFGTVEVLPDGQGLMLQPDPAASGSTSLRYRITDGDEESTPATVALTVKPERISTAPQWCDIAVENCRLEWPSPELEPGGTLVLPALEGWVDPEGDPMMLAGAVIENEDAAARVTVSADGRLAIRHADQNASDEDIAVAVTVADARGESTEKTLRVRVRSGAQAEFAPLAATVTTAEPTVLKPLTRATGGSGAFVLVGAEVEAGTAEVDANQSSGTLRLTAARPGVSAITVTVRDAETEAEIRGRIRVTATEDGERLALPPLRAFVRPLGDTTIEVLDAIPGAGDRSLVVASAMVSDGELRADVIEHARIRLSGITADGRPGKVGAVDLVVSEGDESTTGRITVFQVPDVASGAIAVPDTARVRAGQVVDIPVLENDVAPAGERLVLAPDVTGSGAEDELVFASGAQVRYLAPTEPGDYTLSYSAYGASTPEEVDTGRISVTVIPSGSNRDPRPPGLTVRVAPGEQMSVQVPLSRVDPDGDRVRLVDVEAVEAKASGEPAPVTSILPRTGSVQVSAPSNSGPGTVFTHYTVRDGFGGEGRGRLRIIVTDPDPAGGAPVVYSDYARLLKGGADQVPVRPLDNDLDPSGGALEIVEVVPYVPGGEGSPEYRELAGRIDLSRKDQGIVGVRGGGGNGAATYRYTVRSDRTKSTADGLIVVEVSERPARQAPMVQDTVLSVRDRSELQQGGVDVVTGRVQWSAGDVAGLRLSLHGDAAQRYRASGARISGQYAAEGDLVPFKLAGPDASGETVETYGFVIVPPLDELRLTLQPSAPPLEVDEGEEVESDVAKMLDLGPGDRIELADGAYAVQRGQASCVKTGTAAIRYTAGRSQPWQDTCTVRVKLAEQTVFTALPIPVEIVPDSPQVRLNPLTRTIAPGATQTVDLSDMVEWQGGREGDPSRLRWQPVDGGSIFEVTGSGTRVSVTVPAGATPGTQAALPVAVGGAGSSTATLTLRVGEAPRDTPRGGTVSLKCDVGSACSAPLVGIPGEHDPFAGRSGGGLEVVSVDGGGCRFGTLGAAGDTLEVTWADQRGPGGTCTASFTVQDAQKRTGTGKIEFDARGVPRAPQSIVLSGYDEDSVTLDVTLGQASGAHPKVSGVTVLRDGREAGGCSASGSVYRCEVSGLTAGEAHAFTAVATNAVGDSDPSANSAEAWAYAAPGLSAGEVTVKQESAESASSGTLQFSVSGSDSTVERYEIEAAGKTATIAGTRGSQRISDLAVGAVGYRIVPVSRFAPPKGRGGSSGSAVEGSVDVSGRATIRDPWLSSDRGSRDIAVTVDADANGAGGMRYGAALGESCTPSQSSDAFTIRATAHRRVTVTVCVENQWGGVDSRTVRDYLVGGKPATPVATNWTIAVNPSVTSDLAVYGLESAPEVTADHDLRYTVNGGARDDFGDLDPGRATTASVRQCAGENCSDPLSLSGNAPTVVEVELPDCLATDSTAADLRALVSSAARGAANPSYDGTALTVSWTGAFAGLNALTAPVAPCDPPDPDPDPDDPDGGE